MNGTQLELFTIESLTVAPDYIAKDTRPVRRSLAFNPTSHRVALYTAGELAAMAPEGELYVSFGHVSGIERFSLDRYRMNENGGITVYGADGQIALSHPADRVLRVLTGR